MNERIELFLKKHHCQDYFNSYGELVEDNHYFMYREEMVEFRNMIIEECISMIENEAAQYAEPVWAVELVNDIKDHFGVKE